MSRVLLGTSFSAPPPRSTYRRRRMRNARDTSATRRTKKAAAKRQLDQRPSDNHQPPKPSKCDRRSISRLGLFIPKNSFPRVPTPKDLPPQKRPSSPGASTADQKDSGAKRTEQTTHGSKNLSKPLHQRPVTSPTPKATETPGRRKNENAAARRSPQVFPARGTGRTRRRKNL